MNTDRATRPALLHAAERKVSRRVALEVRRFVAERYPEMVPGLAVASDDGLWMRYRGEFLEHEEADGQSRVAVVAGVEA